jgi:histidinol-phosphate phosphatase family protein
MIRPAVFLDKDGTIVDDVPYNVDAGRIVLSLRAAVGLRMLQRAGYALVVVSNQSGVARGYFALEALDAVEGRLRALLLAEGVQLDGFYFCPHHPQGRVMPYAVACLCRKPLPGMLHRAAADLDLDLPRSWLIGDILHDIEAGRRAGCRTVLLDNGNETEWNVSYLRTPHITATDIGEAAARILAVDSAAKPLQREG